ncbi:MAG: rhamnosyltransferase [Psychroserpens sp.]|jgi:rhamnosyltransferase
MTSKYSLSNLGFILVLYKQEIKDSTTFQSLNKSVEYLGQEQKADLFVYDNSPMVRQEVTNLVDHKFNIYYVHDIENSGVSKAYNEGWKWAHSFGKSWLVLLDQDTFFPNYSISKYLDSINLFSNVNLHVPILFVNDKIYSPCKIFFTRGFNWNSVKPSHYNLNNKGLLNSGILISLDSYERAGGYNEKIPLYFSDFDFVNRLRKNAETLKVIDIRCEHTLSDVIRIDKKSAFLRFKYYCSGAAETYQGTSSIIFAFIMVFLRAIKLSFKFKSIRFLKIFSEYFL